MKLIFGIIAFLITYGSLYPFNFSLDNYSQAGLSAVFNFDLSKTYASDLIANIVLFIPFGMLFCAAFPKNLTVKKYTGLLIIAFMFAFCIQVMQLWTVGRVPWGGDAIWNTVGCLVGFILFSLVNLDALNRVKALENYKQISLALGAIIIIFKLAPFAPALDFQVLKDNIKALLSAPNIDWYWLFESCVFWLCAFYLLRIARASWAKLQTLSVIVTIVLSAKFIIVSSDVNLSQLLGGALALVIWGLVAKRIQPWYLAFLMLFSIVANGLYPFELRAIPANFNWLPFSGSISGNILINIIAMIKKLIFYGTSVWLIYLATRKLALGAIIVSVLVFASEFTQQYFTNSSPEITDTFLVIFIAFVLFILLNHQSSFRLPNELEQVEYNKETGANAGNAISKINVFDAKPVHQNLNYIAGLDGLRAFAALAVFVVHFQQFSDISGSLGFIDFERWMINGNTGVALFFVLSGFLLSSPFWQKMSLGERPSWRHYFTNRIIRIVPIYYLCMFGIMTLKGFSGADINFNNIVSHLFFLHNLKDYQVMSLNPPFWTLAVEFQFYLLLPFLFLVFLKLGTTRAQILCFLLIPIVYLAYRSSMQYLEGYENWPINFSLIWPFGVHMEKVNGQALTYSLFAHLPHFLFGVFAASLLTLRQKLSSTYAEGLFWLSSLLVFFILSTGVDDSMQMKYGRYNFPIIPLLLTIIVFTAPLSIFARRLLEFSPIKWLGVISYGIYVFHYPIQNSLQRVFSKVNLDVSEHVLLYFLASLTITILVSHFSFVLLEKPILQKFRSRSASSHEPLAHASKQDITTTKTQMDSKKMQQATPTAKKMKAVVIIIVLIIGVLGIASYGVLNNSTSGKILVEQADWADSNNKEIIFDHHAHTTYSDGTLSIAELTELAFFNGCNAFSITDHSNIQSSFSEQKLAQIDEMRKAYPSLLIFAGIELGMPSYQGREHVNVITTPEYEKELLGNIMQVLRDSSDIQALQRDLLLLSQMTKTQNIKNSAFAIYNHPSRKDINQGKDENLSDIQRWNENEQLITALAGAPGHQRKAKVGSYETKFETIDRWDPAIALVDGTWDQLLAQGKRLWGAIASSDYHNNKMDYAPCEFSRIHVKTPRPSYQGVIDALKAGTFWADHGSLLNRYEFYVSAAQSPANVYPGGTLILPKANVITVNINIERQVNYADDFMRVDIISNCASQNTIVSSEYLPPEANRVTRLFAVSPEQGNCFVRSRIVRETPEQQDLSAYSNPIFIEF